jgi:predicted Zn-dependent peptidase
VRRESEVSSEGMLFSYSCLPEDVEAVLGIAADILLRPHLETAQFEACLTQAESALEGLEDAPDQQLFTLLNGEFFASPHGRSPFGTAEGLASLRPQSVRADWKKRFSPHGALIAASGNLEGTLFHAAVNQHFGAWHGVAQVEPALEVRTGFYSHQVVGAAQTHIGLIYPSLRFVSPGYYESRFALEVLSGSQSNRLFNEVRERRGLAYSVSASTTFYKSAAEIGSSLEVYAASTPDRAQETLDVLRGEVRQFAAGISQAEFQRARIGILTNLALFEESSSARAATLVRDWRLLGRIRSLEEIRAGVEAVTFESINAWLAANPFTHGGIVTLGQEPLEVAGRED